MTTNRIVATGERAKLIASLCRGLDVLDVGCGEHELSRVNGANWLHGILKGVARTLVGVEVSPVLVEEMRNAGYIVVQGDAQTIDLGQTFDIVVAGEVIEHVDDQLGLLDNLKKHLRDNGRVIISTPNSVGWTYAAMTLILGAIKPNPEHALWHDETTLREITRRAGLEPEAVYYLPHTPLPDNPFGNFLRHIDKLFMMVRPRLAPTLVMVCKRPSP